jgi:hypothetical protein
MAKRTAYLFIFDGYADREPAPTVAELRRTFGFNVKTFARGSSPVVTRVGSR